MNQKILESSNMRGFEVYDNKEINKVPMILAESVAYQEKAPKFENPTEPHLYVCQSGVEEAFDELLISEGYTNCFAVIIRDNSSGQAALFHLQDSYFEAEPKMMKCLENMAQNKENLSVTFVRSSTSQSTSNAKETLSRMGITDFDEIIVDAEDPAEEIFRYGVAYDNMGDTIYVDDQRKKQMLVYKRLAEQQDDSL